MMRHITLDDEQARIIAESEDHVEIRDRNGRPLGYVARGFTESDIAIAKERLQSSEPRYTTQEVLARIQSSEGK